MIDTDLKKRNLPDLLKFNDGKYVKNIKDFEKRKNEIREILCKEEYGYFPKEHFSITAKILEENLNYCGSSAIYKKVLLTLNIKKCKFSFPIDIAIPKLNKPCPAFLYISFTNEFPNKYLPVEEICDNGFAIVSFCYKDITSDDNNFNDGLCKFFNKGNANRDFGKILLWSFAAMHVMDYMQNIDGIDNNNVAIVGQSRLGKTALLTGAFDERFKFTISNDSGQSGAALSRGKEGETVKLICDRFDYWFCTNYNKYSNKENCLPFDQHYLLSLIAPRYLYVSSASEDSWADPKSEFLCCVATNCSYELYNKKGIIHKNNYPTPNEKFHEGYIGYHLRKGTHYLSRYDWNRFFEYIKKHIDR